MNRWTLSLALGIGLLGASSANAIVVDGNLADWGVTHTGSASDWNGSSFAVKSVEDQTGGGSVYLNPGYGGQAYDAEAMYVTWSASTLYIAFATGQNPNGSNTSYAPGDIAIDIGNNGTWDYGIELQGNGGLTQGRVYASPTWTGFGLWSTNDPTSLASGTGVGSVGQVAYTTTGQTNYGQYTTDQHYFYEVAVPLSAFGSSMNVGAQFKVHWTMGCANDVMVVSTTRNVTSKVPEPGTLALLPLGLIGIAALRRRARS